MGKEDLDLSDIKENDLDKTAGFTDLMSRKEKKEYERAKQNVEETIEFKTEDLQAQVSEEKKVIVEDEPKEEEKKSKKDKKKKKSKKEKLKEEEEAFDDELSKTQKLFEITRNFDELNKNSVKSNMANNVIMAIFILGALGYYIYSVVANIYGDDELYLLINGVSLLSLVVLYCSALLSSKKLAIAISVLIYIIIAALITFNVMPYFI